MRIRVKAGHDLCLLHDALDGAKLLREGDLRATLTYDRDDPLLLIVPAKEGVTEEQVRAVVEQNETKARPAPPDRKKLLADYEREAPGTQRSKDALVALLRLLV